MSIFEEARQHTNKSVIMKLLTILAESPETTQRDLATEMGISLGMVVSYMKMCVHKGYVRSKQVAPKRWAYFVTPTGFAEKSKMVSKYLYRSLSFFRNTRIELENLFDYCRSNNVQSIAMVGIGPVNEIASLVFAKANINLIHLDSNEISSTPLSYDAILITDVEKPQQIFDELKSIFPEEKILSIPLLCITRNRVSIPVDTNQSLCKE